MCWVVGARATPVFLTNHKCVCVCVCVCVFECWGVLGGGGRWPAGDLTNESSQRTIVRVSWYQITGHKTAFHTSEVLRCSDKL